MRNPVVKGKIDRALSKAQDAVSELTIYGGHPADLKLGDDLWTAIEAMRRRLRAREK